MQPLGVVVCPLPVERPAARCVRALLDAAEKGSVRVYCTEPFQAPAAWHRAAPVLPIGDLAHDRGAGAVGAPVFVRDGGPGEGAFASAQRLVPGADVAVDDRALPDLAALRRAAAAVIAPPGGVAAPAGGPRVEAMVLAYRSRDYVAPCLESLLQQDWPELAITVLDNASGDGTAEFVRRRFPTIEVLESRENLGFAAGHNVLFERTRADWVALLNHDAVARRDWVRELVTAAQALPNAAVVGGKMLMRRCPTILNSTGIVMNEAGFAIDRDIGRRDVDPRTEPQRVFAVCGGAMLIRTDVLRRLRGFDPTFFMYVEDVDLCWRARLCGHEVYYVPTATVVHDWHGDLAVGSRPAEAAPADVIAAREGHRRFMVERNRLQTVVKNWELRRLIRIWRRLRRHDAGRIAALAAHVERGGGALPQRVLEAVRDARSWVWRHAPSLLRRRFAAQRLRTVRDETFLDLIEPGCGEPAGAGDLHAIVDRHCANGRAAIAMATDDAGALGPGWHQAERAADGSTGLRWSMGESWFYLRREDASWSGVAVRGAPRPVPGDVELWVDGTAAGGLRVAAGEPLALRWRLPEAVPAGRLVECLLRCTPFVPRQCGLGDDARELGIQVAAITTT